MSMEVTFRQFKRLMERRHRSIDDLVDLLRGTIDEPRLFFERVFSCQRRNPETNRYEDRGDVVIPYASVIDLYKKELHFAAEMKKTGRAKIAYLEA